MNISSPPQVPISHIEQDFRSDSSTFLNLDSIQGNDSSFAKMLENFSALSNERNSDPNPGIGDISETQRSMSSSSSSNNSSSSSISGKEENSGELAAANAQDSEIGNVSGNLSGKEPEKETAKEISAESGREPEIQPLIADKNEFIPFISMLQDNPLNEINENRDQNIQLSDENQRNVQELANWDNGSNSLEDLINLQGSELSNFELIELIEDNDKLIPKENLNFESLLREGQDISGKEIPVSLQNLHEEESKPVKEVHEKSRPHIEIRDLRTERNPSMENRTQPENLKTDTGIKIEIPVELSSARAMDEPNTGMESKGGREISQSRFEDALARELRTGLSSEIVKNAQIIVRDGGEGTIRLSLRPASLGDVKIRIEMVENKIMGLIILETNEALRAFERELAVLEKNFRDSGFSDASFTLSLENEAWNFDGHEQERDGENINSSMEITGSFAAFRYEADREDIVVYSNSGGRNPINLLV